MSALNGCLKSDPGTVEPLAVVGRVWLLGNAGLICCCCCGQRPGGISPGNDTPLCRWQCHSDMCEQASMQQAKHSVPPVPSTPSRLLTCCSACIWCAVPCHSTLQTGVNCPGVLLMRFIAASDSWMQFGLVAWFMSSSSCTSSPNRLRGTAQHGTAWHGMARSVAGCGCQRGREQRGVVASGMHGAVRCKEAVRQNPSKLELLPAQHSAMP
jgi:hypothetical protein